MRKTFTAKVKREAVKSPGARNEVGKKATEVRKEVVLQPREWRAGCSVWGQERRRGAPASQAVCVRTLLWKPGTFPPHPSVTSALTVSRKPEGSPRTCRGGGGGEGSTIRTQNPTPAFRC